MIDRTTLKEILITIKNEGFKVPEDYKAMELGYAMMNHIGDTDPVLRDELIYEVLAQWTINDIFNVSQLKELLQLAFDQQHLLNHLGHVNDDSVFTRAFSLLFIAVAVYKHQKDPYLTRDEVTHYFRNIVSYLEKEQDVRGFVEKKGWAHAVAHCADVLAQFASCEELEAIHHQELLRVITPKISHRDYTYRDEEDERIVNAVEILLKQNKLEKQFIYDWINNLLELGTFRTFPDDSVVHINVKHFLRSLYFRLLDCEEHEPLLQLIKDGLRTINKFKE